MIRRLALVMIIFAFASSARAQAVSSCQAVYADSVRNVDLQSRVLSEQSDVYSRHCETNGSLKSSSASLDLSVPVKAIKIGFSGGRSEAKQAMQDFCKSHTERLDRFSSFYQLSNSVVVDALRSFNQCVALEEKRVEITHTTTESRSLVVKVGFNPAERNVTLNSVQYDNTVATCSTNIVGDGPATQLSPAPGQIKAKGPFSVACERIALATSAGDRRFPRLELLVDTNQGAYTVSMPAEDMLGYDLASKNRAAAVAATQRQLDLEAEISSVKGEASALRAAMKKPKVQVLSIAQGSGLGPSALSCASSPDKYANGTCPAPGVRTSIYRTQPERSGGTCGYRRWQWTCVTYP